LRGLGAGPPMDFNSLLVFTTANIAGAINHWRANG
jgi:hypothetical protein